MQMQCHHTDSLKPSYLCVLPLFINSFRQCPRARINQCASSTSDALNWSSLPVFMFLNIMLLLCSFSLPGFYMHDNTQCLEILKNINEQYLHTIFSFLLTNAHKAMQTQLSLSQLAAQYRQKRFMVRVGVFSWLSYHLSKKSNSDAAAADVVFLWSLRSEDMTIMIYNSDYDVQLQLWCTTWHVLCLHPECL